MKYATVICDITPRALLLMIYDDVSPPPNPLVTGALAWRLYDTYGFPVDLTQLMAEERKLTIDMEGFKKAKLCAQVCQWGYQ